MNLSRRAIALLALILGLNGLTFARTAMLPFPLTNAVVVAATSSPVRVGLPLFALKLSQADTTDAPLKPDYTEAFIRFIGVVGAFTVVIWMNRRRQ